MPATNTVYVAEKPSVARDIAAFLSKQAGNGGKYDKKGGYYEVASRPNQVVVTYPVGHIIATEFPDAYLTSEQNRSDAFTYLPIFPDPFKQHPRYEMAADRKSVKKDSKGQPVLDPQWKVLSGLIEKADVIVNAGDVGREGQLIFDEILEYMQLDPYAPNVKRMAMIDPSEEGLQRAFASMGLNSEPTWVNRSLAAKARSEADWIVGMNASRAYQSVTKHRYVALGRVKTPVLSLVSERCKAIEAFKPVTFWTPVVTMADGMVMRWKARTDFEGTPGFNEDGKIIDRAVAEAICRAINDGAKGRVTDSRSVRKKQSAPVGFSLTTLQAHISAKMNCSIEEVKNAAQKLYETHKCITYVGTDCVYYPDTMIAEARGMMRELSPTFTKLMTGANASRQTVNFLTNAQIKTKSKAAEEPEHYAIAPKGAAPNLGSLTPVERATYETIVRRFAAQFYPDFEYQSTAVKAAFSADQFEASMTETLVMGWKDAEGMTDSPDENAEVDVVTGKPVAVIEEERTTQAPGE